MQIFCGQRGGQFFAILCERLYGRPLTLRLLEKLNLSVLQSKKNAIVCCMNRKILNRIICRTRKIIFEAFATDLNLRVTNKIAKYEIFQLFKL